MTNCYIKYICGQPIIVNNNCNKKYKINNNNIIPLLILNILSLYDNNNNIKIFKNIKNFLEPYGNINTWNLKKIRKNIKLINNKTIKNNYIKQIKELSNIDIKEIITDNTIFYINISFLHIIEYISVNNLVNNNFILKNNLLEGWFDPITDFAKKIIDGAKNVINDVIGEVTDDVKIVKDVYNLLSDFLSNNISFNKILEFINENEEFLNYFNTDDKFNGFIEEIFNKTGNIFDKIWNELVEKPYNFLEKDACEKDPLGCTSEQKIILKIEFAIGYIVLLIILCLLIYIIGDFIVGIFFSTGELFASIFSVFQEASGWLELIGDGQFGLSPLEAIENLIDDAIPQIKNILGIANLQLNAQLETKNISDNISKLRNIIYNFTQIFIQEVLFRNNLKIDKNIDLNILKNTIKLISPFILKWINDKKNIKYIDQKTKYNAIIFKGEPNKDLITELLK